MIALSQYILESIPENHIKIETSQYGSELLPFIVIKETTKAFVVKWRTRQDERVAVLPKWALEDATGLLGQKPDKKDWYTFWHNPFSEVLPDYKMFKVKHSFIKKIRNESDDIKDATFFDDWYEKINMFQKTLNQTKQQKRLIAASKLFILYIKKHKIPINIDWVEITHDNRLVLKSDIGIRDVEYSEKLKEFTIISNDIKMHISNEEVHLSSDIVKSNQVGFIDMGLNISNLQNTLITYALTNKYENAKAYKEYMTALDSYNSHYQKGPTDKYYKTHAYMYQQLLNIANFIQIKTRNTELLKLLSNASKDS